MNTGTNRMAAWLRRPAMLVGTVAAAAVFLTCVPLTIDHSGLHRASALAGKGNGKDNGNGGGHGRGGGKAFGHSNTGHGANGTKVKLPGSLNASNAAPAALDHANRRSRVGALGAYMDAMTDYADAVDSGDPAAQEAALDAAAAALADAANKDIEIDAGVVDAVNQALDGKREGFDHTGEPGDPIHEAEQDIADRINPPPM